MPCCHPIKRAPTPSYHLAIVMSHYQLWILKIDYNNNNNNNNNNFIVQLLKTYNIKSHALLKIYKIHIELQRVLTQENAKKSPRQQSISPT